MFYLDDYQEQMKKHPEMFMKVTIPNRKYDFPDEKSSVDIDQFLNEFTNYKNESKENDNLMIDNFLKEEDSSDSECEFKCNVGVIPDYYPSGDDDD